MLSSFVSPGSIERHCHSSADIDFSTSESFPHLPKEPVRTHVPVYTMSQDQLSMYATYMSVLGNREDLFPNSGYVDKYITNPPADYDVNPAYLSDETFAALLEEAEKYIGYPYGATRSQLKRLGTCPMIGGEKKDR